MAAPARFGPGGSRLSASRASRGRPARVGRGRGSRYWLVLSLLLVGCNPAADAPGAASPGEEQALNDAAAALDANASESNAAEIVDEPAHQEQPQ